MSEYSLVQAVRPGRTAGPPPPAPRCRREAAEGRPRPPRLDRPAEIGPRTVLLRREGPISARGGRTAGLPDRPAAAAAEIGGSARDRCFQPPISSRTTDLAADALAGRTPR